MPSGTQVALSLTVRSLVATFYLVLIVMHSEAALSGELPFRIGNPAYCSNLLLGRVVQAFYSGIAKFSSEDNVIEIQKSRLKNWPRRDIRKIPLVNDFLKEHPVFISLTTSPKRISHLHHVIQTLDLANVQKVFISIPEKFGRTGEPYLIPDELLINPKIEIIRVPIDEGPATKFLPAVDRLQLQNPDAYLITVDDDNGYAFGMINELIFAAANAPNSAISGSGQMLSHWRIGGPQGRRTLRQFSDSRMTLSEVEVIENYLAIIQPVKSFPTQMIRQWLNFCSDCFVSDDLVISLALAKRRTPLFEINSKYFNRQGATAFRYGMQSDALYRGAGLSYSLISGDIHAHKYRRTYEALEPFLNQR